jgi:hypothetical protein
MNANKLLTAEGHEELPTILDLLGLDRARLDQEECESILGCFLRVPYEVRTGEMDLCRQLELIKRGVRALIGLDAVIATAPAVVAEVAYIRMLLDSVFTVEGRKPYQVA